MNQRSGKTVKICLLAMLAALAILLEYFANLTIPMLGGNMKISFAGLPVILAAMLMGPWAGFAAGFVSSFLGQVVSYGLTVTTLLWVLPAAVRGLTVGYLFRWFRGRTNPLLVGTEITVSGLIVTAFNTLAIYADSKIFGYYKPEIILGFLGLRILSSAATSVVCTLIALPLYHVLSKRLMGQGTHGGRTAGKITD